jgi:RAS protein activator-like 2
MDGFNQRPGVNRDLKHRTEHAFQLWILEAKGIPAKQSYYCEICLDRQFYKRTSSKYRSDICFWGEYFEERQVQT